MAVVAVDSAWTSWVVLVVVASAACVSMRLSSARQDATVRNTGDPNVAAVPAWPAADSPSAAVAARVCCAPAVGWWWGWLS